MAGIPGPRVRRKQGSRASSIAVFLSLVGTWWIALTLLFSVLFDDFLYRLTHPFDSGWAKGPWGFLLIYALLTLPVFRVYDWLQRETGSTRPGEPRDRD